MNTWIIIKIPVHIPVTIRLLISTILSILFITSFDVLFRKNIRIGDGTKPPKIDLRTLGASNFAIFD